MFNKARLKLTAWYLLIIMIISISFSAVIFRVLSSEVERFDRIQRSRIEVRFGFAPFIPVRDPALIEETEKRIITSLILINSGILILSGISSYVLAGITLNPIKEMLDEQNRFISDASHEINTPLTSLKTAMEVFLRSKNTTLSEAKELTTESITEVNKLQALSKSLLQLAQYEKPNGHSKMEILSINEVVNSALKNINPIAKNKKIKINSKIQNIKLNANIYGLTDLLTIILENSIKYSPNNSTIELVVKKEKNEAIVSITDEGIGIDKKDIPHIFDRFYRTDIARSKKDKGGYGLGLSIAKKIVENHKGTISVKSELGKGSVFTIHLPA